MAQVLEIPVADRRELERLAASTVEPHRRVVQAKALLDLADGVSVSAMARQRCAAHRSGSFSSSTVTRAARAGMSRAIVVHNTSVSMSK
jgi:hypothetical protein